MPHDHIDCWRKIIWQNSTPIDIKTPSKLGPGGTSGKEPACQCRSHQRHRFSPWAGKTPWRRKWQPTPVFLPGDSHGQRSLAGYSPWGRKGQTWLTLLSPAQQTRNRRECLQLIKDIYEKSTANILSILKYRDQAGWRCWGPRGSDTG